ncbi:MAG: AEC family transporter [Lachnospiraceae bacterium]|nr:AEC family transporter [Lachnospiraceae bacterium]
MEGLIVSLRAVFPIFSMLVIGYWARWKGIVDDPSIKKMNALCFQVFMTAMMFYNVYSMDLESDLNPRLMAFAIAAILTILAVATVIVLWRVKENAKRGVIIQAIYRSNFVVLGLPLITAVYGSEAAGVPTVLISVVTPLYNFFAVIILEIFNGTKPSVGKIAKNVILCPYILGAIAAMFFVVTGLQLPEVIVSLIQTLGQVASPLAIVILGASFSFGNVRKYAGVLAVICSVRLLLIPGITLTVAAALGFREVELMTVVALFATPTAIASYAMAQQLGGDADLAGVEVVMSTMLSVVTLFFWIFLLKNLGLL